MFHRIHDYGLIEASGRVYRPRAYGEPQADGSWAGWLIFFPVVGGLAIAPPARETTQRSAAALELWAAGVSAVYLEGALARALHINQQSPVVAQLLDSEYGALEDAARFDAAAHIERAAADLDEVAAEAARVEAEQIHRDRLEVESKLAAIEEEAATTDATLHEQAAREARAVAADAQHRRRSAQAEAKSQLPQRRGGKKR